MKKTKIQFRALRECVGLSLAELAERLNVNVRSVKRWESPTYQDYKPPQDAWELLERLQAKQLATVKQAKKKKTLEIEYSRDHAHAVQNATARALAVHSLASSKCAEVQFVEEVDNDHNN